MVPEMPARMQRERLARPYAMDVDSIEIRPRVASWPSTAQQGHPVPDRGQTPEDFVKVDLGPSSLRIGAILPVHQKYVHLHAPHTPCEGVKNAIDEARTVRRTIPLGEAHGLLKHHTWRSLRRV
jgi:hypothetical protein